MKCVKLFLISIAILAIIMVNPAAADYTMFHADEQRTGAVVADGPLTNNTRWVTELPEFPDSSPVVYGDKMFIATWPDMDFADGDPMALYCLDVNTGSEIWNNSLGTGYGSISGMAIADNKIFLGGTDGKLYGININDGSTADGWPKQVNKFSSYYGLSSSPLAHKNLLYVLSATDGLHVYDYNGAEQWSYKTGPWNLPDWSGNIINDTYYSSPSIKGNSVFFGGMNESRGIYEMYCVDITTQNKVWNFTVDGMIRSAPVIGTDGVYFTTTTKLYALSVTDGSEKWAAIDIKGTPSTPALSGGLLYVGTKDGLTCYDTTDGSAKWSSTCTSKVAASPVIAGNTVYFATNEVQGQIFALDKTNGNEIWHHTQPDLGTSGGWPIWNLFSSSPAVSDGTLFIGAEDSKVYAFGPGANWETTVTLTPGTKIGLTDGAEVNATTAAGAIHAASSKCGFNTMTSNGKWGPSLDSLGEMTAKDIGGGVWEYWQQFDNSASSLVGLGYECRDGDTISFCYGSTGILNKDADNLVTIHVVIPENDISGFSIPATAERGSSMIARLNVTERTTGWYAIVVSGTNDAGDSIAGIGTVHLDANTEMDNIPVLVQIPAQADTGDYTLYAGVYTFENYPYTKIIDVGGEVCTIL